MKRRFVSVFSNPDPKHNLLWRASEVKRLLDIQEPILMQGNLYKVKAENKMDPKFFTLTKDSLYYTYVEQTEEIQGVLSLRWLLVEFVEPANSRVIKEFNTGKRG